MSRAAKFLLGFASGALALIACLAVAFVALERTGRLKAPAFTNRMSFDEKIRYLREEPVGDPKVLLIGSSTTLHGVDGEVLADEFGAGVANLGVQDVRINQSRFMARVFLSRFDRVDHVVMVSTLLDFKDCSSTETRFFDPEHVVDYLDGGSDLYYHFKYLDLEGVLKRANDIRHLRNARDALESVSFDDHGGLLLDLPREAINPRVWEGDPITLDPACYDHLARLARDLAAAGVKFTYVIAPMRPGYLANRDPDGELLAEHRRRIAERLGATEAVVIDAHASLDMPEDAFFDAYHLNRDKARQMTRYVGEQITTPLGDREEETGVTPAAAVNGRHHEPAARLSGG